jgi:hypothetical protein
MESQAPLKTYSQGNNKDSAQGSEEVEKLDKLTIMCELFAHEVDLTFYIKCEKQRSNLASCKGWTIFHAGRCARWARKFGWLRVCASSFRWSRISKSLEQAESLEKFFATRWKNT